MSVNSVMLIGRVGNNPQVRNVGDSKVATFSLATSENYKGKDGNWVESTEWHTIVAWNKLAEKAEKIVTSGAQLYVNGKIKTEKYTDKEGKERFATKIFANDIQLLGGKKEDSVTQQKPQNSPSPFDDDDNGDDMPF